MYQSDIIYYPETMRYTYNDILEWSINLSTFLFILSVPRAQNGKSAVFGRKTERPYNNVTT